MEIEIIVYRNEGFSGEDLRPWLRRRGFEVVDLEVGMVKVGKLPEGWKWENNHPHRRILWHKKKNRWVMEGIYFPGDKQMALFEFHDSPIDTAGD